MSTASKTADKSANNMLRNYVSVLSTAGRAAVEGTIEVDKLILTKMADAALADFGALNVVSDRRALARELHGRLRPGSPLIYRLPTSFSPETIVERVEGQEHDERRRESDFEPPLAILRPHLPPLVSPSFSM